MTQSILDFLRKAREDVPPDGIYILCEGAVTTFEAGVVPHPNGSKQVILTVINSAWDSATAMRCAEDLNALVREYMEEEGASLYGVTYRES